MDIPFTKEQYHELLKIAYLGGWLANSRRTEDELKDISRIEQHIYSFAAQFGAGGLIEENDGEYFPTRGMEDLLLPIIDEYDDNAFWDDLIDRLAARDILAEHGEERIGKIDPNEYDGQLDERASVYEEEFEEFGLDRLQIVER